MADDFDLRPFKDEGDDRLPWLETVEPDEEPHRPIGRILAGLVVAAVVALALVLGVRSYRAHNAGGHGDLIAAQDGDYKVKPDDPGGLKVSGEGTSAVATSAGKGVGTGAIDLKAVPEAPVAGTRAHHAAPTPAAVGAHKAVAAVPGKGGKLVAAAPVAVAHAAAAASGGGSLVQLGAYPTEAAANAAWTSFAKRFAYVASLGKSVQTVAIDGKTFYRLRVNAGSANQAADICGRLKVAGEACFVAS